MVESTFNKFKQFDMRGIIYMVLLRINDCTFASDMSAVYI